MQEQSGRGSELENLRRNAKDKTHPKTGIAVLVDTMLQFVSDEKETSNAQNMLA